MSTVIASSGGVVRLPHWGVLRAQGPEAAAFLHAQLTQDFLSLDMSHARLAAFCSPQGRMQASFIGFKRSAEEIFLLCSADVLPATLKRLSMFVLRAKVQLSDATPEYAVYGLVGNAVGQAAQPWSKTEAASASLVHLPKTLGQARVLWCTPITEAAPPGPSLELSLWQWLQVHSGIAMVTGPLVNAFVPQMLNYESIGGVNFKKGCYPGQEVVARSQFRGTLKRRTYLAHIAQATSLPCVGQEIFQAQDAQQACGMVLASAACPDLAGFDVLLSMQVAFAEQNLTLGSPTGPELSLRELPYPLLQDI